MHKSNPPFQLALYQLAPFTDLDTDGQDVALRWKSAKFALIVMMRTWVGVALVASDGLGLPTLVAMLKDKKVVISSPFILLLVHMLNFKKSFRLRRYPYYDSCL